MASCRQKQQEIPLLYGFIHYSATKKKNCVFLFGSAEQENTTCLVYAIFINTTFMNKKCWLLLSTVCLLALAACDDCRDSDCADGDYKFLIFQSEADGSDLILGGVYRLDSLRILPMLIDPSKPGARVQIDLDYKNAYIMADANTAGYIIQLDSLPPDTLLATVAPSVGDDCCPSVTEFKTLVLNGQPVPSDYTACCVFIQK